MKHFLPACAAAALCVLSGCASSTCDLAPPVAQLNHAAPCCEQGRRIYLTNCTKCHSVEAIRTHSLAEWQSDIMPQMGKKAKLMPDQYAAVMGYVEAVIHTPPAPKS